MNTSFVIPERMSHSRAPFGIARSMFTASRNMVDTMICGVCFTCWSKCSRAHYPGRGWIDARPKKPRNNAMKNFENPCHVNFFPSSSIFEDSITSKHPVRHFSVYSGFLIAFISRLCPHQRLSDCRRHSTQTGFEGTPRLGSWWKAFQKYHIQKQSCQRQGRKNGSRKSRPKHSM